MSFYEFPSQLQADVKHRELTRLGRTCFEVFQTAKGTWAFHVN